MRGLRRISIIAAATGLLAAGSIAVGTMTADASTVGSCTARGNLALCSAGGGTAKPLTITATVTSTPTAKRVTVFWDTWCVQGPNPAQVHSSGQFDATTPVTRTIGHAYHQPDSCVVSVTAGLDVNATSIKLVVSASSTPPPPKVTAIKGYQGKCADDPGNSSANGAKVQIWSCTNGASQNWSFSGGLLKHNGKCANDNGNGGNGSKVILYACTTAQNDLWTHKPNGEYVLKAHGGTLCLTDPGNSAKNGTQLTVATCKNTANQHWTLP